MTNIKITEHIGGIPKHSRIYREIISLVKYCPHELSMFIYTKESDLFDYLSAREQVRAELLLDSIGAKGIDKKHLILASSQDSGDFLGFAICSPCMDEPQRVSITMVAVKADFRGIGVLKQILETIRANFSFVSLTCKPSLVPLYEKYGFHISGVFQTHICMTNSDDNQSGRLASVDDEYVMQHPSVIQELGKLRRKLGESRFQSCIKKWQQDYAVGEQNALNFYAQNVEKKI